ncbi:hypothetical protein B0T26DRAFT_758011 [Lasiosphaeria miniovina]|uniref:Dipeptidyl peptidase III n=1 Tax=Lasiosphaeria miniovina TaxID=1954250 RepID=A0AA39ZR24_9PEZI|nr:uncharacterized protein B0T26DRAFT_758011 [Lasiosphaeria miniovina]KAK0702056.1 hypothetical protein B0T26DRAFT_758011 [Lasiosphaeria miniovina]
MNHFRDSQKAWLKDKDSRVELILGFVEPCRDPAGLRAGFESEDIRDTCGFKNVMIANRNRPPNLGLVNAEKEAPFVAAEEAREYLSHEYYSSEIRIAAHELLGHGTGNRLAS